MAQAVMGNTGKYWWIFVSLAASSSAVSAVYAVVPRLLYGMSREGSVPAIFGYLHPRFRSPWTGIFVCYAITLVFGIVYPGWFFLFSVAAFAWISTYVLVVASAIWLRRKDKQTPRPFRMPLFPFLPAVGLIGMVLVLFFFRARHAAGRRRALCLLPHLQSGCPVTASQKSSAIKPLPCG